MSLFATINSKYVQSNLVIRNVLIRNKFVLRNHFPWPNANLLQKDKEHLALRSIFRMTKKSLSPSLTVHTMKQKKKIGNSSFSFLLHSEFDIICSPICWSFRSVYSHKSFLPCFCLRCIFGGAEISVHKKEVREKNL